MFFEFIQILFEISFPVFIAIWNVYKNNKEKNRRFDVNR